MKYVAIFKNKYVFIFVVLNISLDVLQKNWNNIGIIYVLT